MYTIAQKYSKDECIYIYRYGGIYYCSKVFEGRVRKYGEIYVYYCSKVFEEWICA